jgi:hypothetical protein
VRQIEHLHQIFPALSHPFAKARLVVMRLIEAEACHSFFECFPYVCPEPVLVICSFYT